MIDSKQIFLITLHSDTSEGLQAKISKFLKESKYNIEIHALSVIMYSPIHHTAFIIYTDERP